MGSAARRLTIGAMCVASYLLAETKVFAGMTARGDEALAAARAWFAAALRDEEAGRYGDALAKFEQVREVRDTAPVEYRIGTCYDGLGQPLAAYLAFHHALTLGEHDADAAAVVEASNARLEELQKVIARLRIAFAASAPTGVEIRVDGALVGPEALGAPIPLASGTHTVTAAARGHLPFRAEVPLSGGADTWVTIALPRDGERGSGAQVSDSAAGWTAFAGGAALVAASAILLVVRREEISALDRNCPASVCPPGADRAELESTRSRALIEGPAAVGCGVAGAVALAAGTILVLRANRFSNSGAGGGLELAPAVGFRAGGVAVRATFR